MTGDQVVWCCWHSLQQALCIKYSLVAFVDGFEDDWGWNSIDQYTNMFD